MVLVVSKLYRRQFLRQFLLLSVGTSFLAGGLGACDRVRVSQYEATAEVIYTWQVEYTKSSDRPADIRREAFASTSLINRNGEWPDEAITGPDDRGLWWPALPPRPTVDEIEARRQNSQEIVRSPELIQTVNYRFTYEDNGETVTLPTEYAVYREAVQAYRQGQPLEVLLGVNNSRVEDVEPVE